MKDIIRMNQLAGIITEGQAKKMMEILNEDKSTLDEEPTNQIPTIADFKNSNPLRGIKMNIGGKEHKLSRYAASDGVSYHAHRKEDGQIFDFMNYNELKDFIKTGKSPKPSRDVSGYDYETGVPKN